MFIQQKVLKYLKNKKGATTVSALVGLIIASMSMFLFKTVENVSEAQKFKIAHLHNAIQIAKAAEIYVSGSLFKAAGVHNFEGTTDGKYTPLDQLSQKLSNTELGVSVTQGTAITLQNLEALGYIEPGTKDPSANKWIDQNQSSIAYHPTRTVAVIDLLDSTLTSIGATGYDADENIHGVEIKVNLAAGVDYSDTTIIKSDQQATPALVAMLNSNDDTFYYFIGATTNADDVSTNSDTDAHFSEHMLSEDSGGPQPENVIDLPRVNGDNFAKGS